MIKIPETSNVPGGGLRQQRAACLKAELEAKSRPQRPGPTTADDDEPEPDDGQRAEVEAVAEASEEQATGPVGSGDHVVKQGECVSSIAKDTGHLWETIWNDAANTRLRAVRKDPNVLLPDDRVTIPEKRQKQEPGETEMRHRFVRRGEPAQLRIQVRNRWGQPFGNRKYVLEAEDTTVEGVTNAEGWLEAPIPAGARRGTLKVLVGCVAGDEAACEIWDLRLGNLDPSVAPAGARQRLANLGRHDATEAGNAAGARFGVARFQADAGLTPHGTLDGNTTDQTRRLHAET